MTEPAQDQRRERVINYVPAGPTIRRFHNDRQSMFRGIMGPFGSGKSSACLMEIVNCGFRQKPMSDGWRRTRWAVVRADYPKLKSTTITTFSEWFPEPIFRKLETAPIEGWLTFDDAKVQIHLYFVSLDSKEDVDKLKSMQLTGIWFNEASEQYDIGVIEMGIDRCGRYPPMKDGGPSWWGAIADTNPPDTDHWWYRYAEELRPKGWTFYRQPGGVIKVKGIWLPNPRAENVANLPGGFLYYTSKIASKIADGNEDYVRVYYGCDYGRIKTGKPVYPSYRDTVHCSGRLETYQALPLLLGWDFGRTPAVAMMQFTPKGQLRVLREMLVDPDGPGKGLRTFIRDDVRPYVLSEFAGMSVRSIGDPSGAFRGQADEVSLFDVAAEEGFPMSGARSNDPQIRIADVEFFLRGTIEGGAPAYLLDERCSWLRRGFLGAYCFERVQVSGEARYREIPTKNKVSHIHDAHQYGASGARHVDVKNITAARPLQPAPRRWGA